MKLFLLQRKYHVYHSCIHPKSPDSRVCHHRPGLQRYRPGPDTGTRDPHTAPTQLGEIGESVLGYWESLSLKDPQLSALDYKDSCKK